MVGDTIFGFKLLYANIYYYTKYTQFEIKYIQYTCIYPVYTKFQVIQTAVERRPAESAHVPEFSPSSPNDPESCTEDIQSTAHRSSPPRCPPAVPKGR